MNQIKIEGKWNDLKGKLVYLLKPMKSHSIHLRLIPLACFAVIGTFFTACSEQTVDPEAKEAVSQVENASDDALEQARESIKETEKLTLDATDQDRAVAKAAAESAIAAANELEARGSEAAAEIKEAVREAVPEAKLKPQPLSSPAPGAE